MALIEKLTAIADAIRSKTGKGDKLTLEQMAEEVNNLSIGNTEMEDGLVTRTLAEYHNDRITEIGTQAFYNFKTLTSASFPNVTKLSGSTHFYGCSNLEKLYFPKLTSGFGSANSLYGCSALKELILPSYEGAIIGVSNCTSLTKVDLNACAGISNNAFYKCGILDTLIIRNGLTSLYNINAFSNTPIESGAGFIYVPRALLSDDDATKDYRRATNWINFKDQFRAIEDYPEICGGAEND